MIFEKKEETIVSFVTKVTICSFIALIFTNNLMLKKFPEAICHTQLGSEGLVL